MHYSTTLTTTLSYSIKSSASIMLITYIKLSPYSSNTNKSTSKLSSTSFKMESKSKRNLSEYCSNDHSCLTSKPKNSSLEVILDLGDLMAEEFILKQIVHISSKDLIISLWVVQCGNLREKSKFLLLTNQAMMQEV